MDTTTMKTRLAILGARNSWFRILVFLVATGLTHTAVAQDAETAMPVSFIVGNLWLLMAAALVFIMHLGFATLEAGLTQHKNTVNILFKNVCIISIGILTYALVGFNLMYPGEDYAGGLGGAFGTVGQGLRKAHASVVERGMSDPEFDRVADHLESALVECRVPNKLVREALQTIDGLREEILNR